MKNKIFWAIAIIGIIGLYAYKNPKVDFKVDEKTGIQFNKESWSNILALAKKENKLIFLDIYATWCGPCKRLKKNTFTNKKVGNFFNSNFINVTMDGEEGEGITISEKYKVSSYPTLYFINSDGKIITKEEGYLNPAEILKFAKSVRK